MTQGQDLAFSASVSNFTTITASLSYIIAISYKWGNKKFLKLISQEVSRDGQAMPQVSLFIVFRVKSYFSLFLINSGVVLFKPAHSKDNRVVNK